MTEPRYDTLTRTLRRAVDVRPAEVHALLLSAAYFFFILSAYYVLRPLRDEMAVASGVWTIPHLMLGTMILMFLVHPPYAALVSKLPRQKFISYTYRFFIANLLIFYILLKGPESWNIWVGRAFYWWVSVFNLFVVSVFWAFMADVFSNDQGKRLFGFIAVGGTLGAIVGAATTAALAVPLGPPQLILISVVLLELAVQCMLRLSRLTAVPKRTRPEESGPRVAGVPEPEPGRGYGARPEEGEVIGGGVLAGITGVFRSPYLLGIVGYMMLFTFAATILYMQQASIIESAFSDRAVRTAFFAKIDLAVNVLTIVTQIFLTGRLIKWLGVAVTLTLLPFICIIGFTSLGLWPTLVTLVVFQSLRRAGNYAVARPTREVLYTVVSREDKYKAKNFIDTFIYRGGDSVTGYAYNGLAALGLSLSAIAFVTAPICGLWLMIGFWLGRRQTVLAKRQVAADAAVQPAPVAT